MLATCYFFHNGSAPDLLLKELYWQIPSLSSPYPPSYTALLGMASKKSRIPLLLKNCLSDCIVLVF